jgi:hypothetical protein
LLPQVQHSISGSPGQHQRAQNAEVNKPKEMMMATQAELDGTSVPGHAATAAFPAPGGHFPEKAIVQAQAESVDDAG